MTEKRKRPLLVAGENNILSGKQLQDMGFRTTADGYFIAATLKYNVWILPGRWNITLRETINKPKIYARKKKTRPT